MGVQVLYVPIQNQQTVKKTMIFTLTNISNNIIKTMLLLCYLPIKGCMLSNFCTQLAQYVRNNRKSFPWAYKYCTSQLRTKISGKKQGLLTFMNYWLHTIKDNLTLLSSLLRDVHSPYFAYSQPSRSELAGNYFHGRTNTSYTSQHMTNKQ